LRLCCESLVDGFKTTWPFTAVQSLPTP